MTTSVALGVVVGFFIVIFAIPRIIALWRGHPSDNWVRVLAMFVGIAAARGIVRAMPLVIVQLVATLVLVVLAPFLQAKYSDMLDSFLTAFSVAYVAVWLLIAWVVFFNRPARLIPPRLRDEPGALAEWVRGRSGKTDE